MGVSLYEVTVPVFQRGLGTLAALLEKGRAYGAAQGIEEAELIGARLAPDMLTLAGQVQRASDTAKLTVVRVGGVENVPFPDEERSFRELHERIDKTRALLEAVPPAALEGREAAMIAAKVGRMAVNMPGRDYVLKFALPNFLFHVTIAYGILRARGVPLGKMDYIGPLD